MTIISINALTSIADETYTDEADIVVEDRHALASPEFLALIAGLVGSIWQDRFQSQPMSISYQCRNNRSTITTDAAQPFLPDDVLIRIAQDLLAGI